MFPVPLAADLAAHVWLLLLVGDVNNLEARPIIILFLAYSSHKDGIMNI